MFKTVAWTAVVVLTLLLAPRAFAHCEVPCGIYDDEMRADLLAEHVTTIEKSMQMIVELSAAQPPNYNQIVRWVTNKDDHADHLQEVVCQYFMTQRVKPASPDKPEDYRKYVEQVTLLHKMLVAAMKAKQTTDLAYVAELRGLIGDFRLAYFGKEEGAHAH